MGIHIEPQFGGTESVGTVFVSYARPDGQAVKNIILRALNQEAIPYFLDIEDIEVGSKAQEVIDEALERSSCGVVVLSPHSVKSPWVWFEMGVLIGRGKKVFSFVVNTAEPESFLEEVPSFAGQYKCEWDIDKLLPAIRAAVFEDEIIFDEVELNQTVRPKLRYVELTVTLQIPDYWARSLSWGLLLVRFGRLDGRPEPDPLPEDRKMILKLRRAQSASVDRNSGEVKIRYRVPVHSPLGTEFKAFVDVPDLSLVPVTIQRLEESGMKDVRRSDSAESQRIYFLLPMEERSIVDAGVAGIPNNYLFPF